MRRDTLHLTCTPSADTCGVWQKGSLATLSRTLLVTAALSTMGCLTSGMYRTARIIPKGEGDFGLNFSLVRSTMDEIPGTNTGKLTVTYPNLLPELSYHYGASENAEVGGRLSLLSGMIEMDAKYRFVHEPTFHMAVQPAVGYRTLGFIEGFHGTLPIILTTDMTPHISLNLSAFATVANFRWADQSSSDKVNFSGKSTSLGGSMGVQFRTLSGFHFMPGVELQRTVYHKDLEEVPGITSLIFGVTLGWGPNEHIRKIDEQSDRIEHKIDRIEQKLEGTE